MGKKKAIAGLTRGRHQDGDQDDLSFTKPDKDEVKVEEEAPLLTRSGMGMQLVREGSRDAASADAASAGAASGPADAEEN